MIHLKQAVIVEGKYDKIKLSNFIDAEIITTNGFGILKDRQKIGMLRRIAEKRGIIILTDSDSAGFLIRGRLCGFLPADRIVNVFVPEIQGREKRKPKPSAEGLLGVEGLSEKIIENALKKAGVVPADERPADARMSAKITSADLYRLGLTGGENSSDRRKALLKRLELPTGMSTGQLLTALNLLYSRDEFSEYCMKAGVQNEQ